MLGKDNNMVTGLEQRVAMGQHNFAIAPNRRNQNLRWQVKILDVLANCAHLGRQVEFDDLCIK